MTFTTTLAVFPERLCKVIPRLLTASIGMLYNLKPLPSNPSPDDVIKPVELTLPATCRGAIGKSVPIPTLPSLVIVILFSVFVLKTRLLLDNNMELLESISKSILLLFRVIIIILCIYKKKQI